jgi:Lrp/AsnC family transcriptional regulator
LLRRRYAPAFQADQMSTCLSWPASVGMWQCAVRYRLSRPIDDHAVMQPKDHGAAGLYEQAWKDRVNEARDARDKHRSSEPARTVHVFEIGFPNTTRMFTKVAFEHAHCPHETTSLFNDEQILAVYRSDGVSNVAPSTGLCRISISLFFPGENMNLDAIDRRILSVLQEDATVSMADLAESVGLSATPCWKRIKRLEQSGVIERRVAILNRERLGLGVSVFASIRTSHHSAEWLQKFADGVAKIPEVVEFYRLSGEIDYLLKIVVRDISDYDRIYRKLIKVTELHDVSSSFAMQEIKFTTALPLSD